MDTKITITLHTSRKLTSREKLAARLILTQSANFNINSSEVLDESDPNGEFYFESGLTEEQANFLGL